MLKYPVRLVTYVHVQINVTHSGINKIAEKMKTRSLKN